MRAAAARAIALAALPALAGCPPRGPYDACPERHLSLTELVAAHNANARKVPRLYARASVRVTLHDERGRSVSWGSALPVAPPNTTVLMSKEGLEGKPPRFLMIGRELSAELFRIGIDADRELFYFWYSMGGSRGAFYGRLKYAGAPRTESMAIDPAQVVEILAVTELPPVEAGATPTVVMRLEGGPECWYVVDYLKPQPVTGKLKLWRQVWFDWDEKGPPRARRVRLYDADGLCRVVAELADYEPIATDAADAPVMPTDIRMTWPAIKGVQPASALHMKLSKVSTTHPFSNKAFDFWSHCPVRDPVQVDSAYGRIPAGGRQ